MKFKLFIVFIAFLIVLSSCSNDEEFKTISPTSIAFVHEDGSPIAIDECITPTAVYALLISTQSEGKGAFKETIIEYTLNGVSYFMTFTNNGKQSTVIKLINGNNVAEIVGTNNKTYLYYDSHENFELVE